MNFYNLTLQTANGKEVTTLYHSDNLTDEQYKGYYNAVIDELTGCARNPIIPSILTYTIVDKLVEKFGFGVVEAKLEIHGKEGGFGYAEMVKKKMEYQEKVVMKKPEKLHDENKGVAHIQFNPDIWFDNTRDQRTIGERSFFLTVSSIVDTVATGHKTAFLVLFENKEKAIRFILKSSHKWCEIECQNVFFREIVAMKEEFEDCLVSFVAKVEKAVLQKYPNEVKIIVAN